MDKEHKNAVSSYVCFLELKTIFGDEISAIQFRFWSLAFLWNTNI